MTSAGLSGIDEPRPAALSRRQQLAGSSARSLLLTVLGELVLPARAAAWTQVLLDVLGELGVEHKAGRQALARTAAEGLLTSERAGRRVRWSLSPTGVRLLSSGARRIYSFGAARPAWDGRWLVLLVSVPETRRQLRHRLRTRLAWAGMGSPAPGVWLCADPGKQPEVLEVIEELGLSEVAASFVGEYGAIGSERAVVDQAWNLAGLEAAYHAFIDAFAASRPTSPGEVLREQILLVHAWRRFPFLDPRLPAELLPGGWVGAKAAELFHERHEQWAETARRRWAALVECIEG